MLRQNRDFKDGLPRKALIDAFYLIEDKELVGALSPQDVSIVVLIVIDDASLSAAGGTWCPGCKGCFFFFM